MSQSDKLSKHRLSTILDYVNKALGQLDELKPDNIQVPGGITAAEHTVYALKAELEKAKITLLNLMR